MEILLYFWFIVFIVQQSSLYLSLILVPYSFTMMFLLSAMMISSFLLYLFIMVFIGGLLVLLVSISSLSTQEQGVMLTNKTYLILVFLVFSLAMSYPSHYLMEVDIYIMSWVLEKGEFLIVSSLLIFSLLVISTLVFEFKGLVRSI